MARTAAPWSKRAGLHDELHDAWHLLGRLLARSNRNYSWLQLLFLFGVTLVPFSTALLARFPTFRLALVEYWLNIVLLGMTLLAGLQYGLRARLFIQTATETPEMAPLMRGRILNAHAPYAVA